MVRELVHQRLRPSAGAVGGAHPLEELHRRRGDVPGGASDCRLPRREPDPDDVDRRIDLLERVVASSEQCLIGGAGRRRSVGVELGLPEARLVRLVADDHVFHGRERAGDLLLEGDEPVGTLRTHGDRAGLPGPNREATRIPRKAATGGGLDLLLCSISRPRLSQLTVSRTSLMPTSFSTPKKAAPRSAVPSGCSSATPTVRPASGRADEREFLRRRERRVESEPLHPSSFLGLLQNAAPFLE